MDGLLPGDSLALGAAALRSVLRLVWFSWFLIQSQAWPLERASGPPGANAGLVSNVSPDVEALILGENFCRNTCIVNLTSHKVLYF